MSRRPRVIAFLLAGCLALVAGCADDSSPLNVVPGTPAALSRLGGGGQTGVVAERLAEPLSVEVRDRFGNPIAGARVAWSVDEGEGTLPESTRTDSAGLATAFWTLGTRAGAQRAEASVGDDAAATFEATARPGPPALIGVVSGAGQEATVASSLRDPVVVRVVDRFENPIPGAAVTWRVVEGGGSLEQVSGPTDGEGRAQASWLLGTVAGPQIVSVSAGTVTRTLGATALADAPAGVEKRGGDEQVAPVDWTLPVPLEARVLDVYGNPVPGVRVDWRAVAGGGSVAGPSSTTGEEGVATTTWTLGSELGPQRAEASVDGVGVAVFSATARERLNLLVTGAYVTQSTQSFAGDVPLVTGRDAYLRVFVETDFSLEGVRPDVRARFYHDGALVETLTAPAPGSIVPTTTDEGVWEASWNLPVPGSLLQPGTELRVDVDPSADVIEIDETDNAFPLSGEALALDVRTASEFRVRLVPVRHTGSGETGNATESNKEQWLSSAQAMFPFPGYDADVRAVYTTDVPDISTPENWNQIIQQMAALRTADASGRYYYGVLRHSSPAYCGLGYIGYPVSIGTDDCGPGTAAHEWGHNFARYHTPCGNPGGVDPDYPYPNARLGVYGLDVANAASDASALKHPEDYADLMSYCGPDWISDYTYEAVLAYRAEEAGQGSAAASAPVQPTLLVWGRIQDGRAVVEPAFVVETRPRLPEEPGPYTLELQDQAGGRVLSLSFAGEEVADLPGEHRHFAFAIPLDRLPLDRVGSLRVSGAGVTPAERVSTAAAPAQAALAVTPSAPGVVRVEWDDDAFPMAVVRDPRTREILSLARGGRIDVATDAPELEVLISEGVRSVPRRLQVPQ